MEHENETFNYTYSAQQQEELQRIRKKYLPPEEDKMEQLRRLDRAVTQKGTTAALVVGVIGTLLLGLGMSCAMVWMGDWFLPGIIIGLVGIALIALAYPLYNRIARRERERVAPEILRLTEELLQERKNR
ncbi:MAG: hypothetical protein IJ357_00300 [Oscillospiraceae bacterium]|nr:hypothetical protein [Oscillospiraceae bacterium]